MILFYATLLLSWWLTKVFWGSKVANFSLLAIIPIGLICTPALLHDDVFLAIALSIIYGIIFIAVNFFVFMGIALFQTDWKNPDNQRAFLQGIVDSKSYSNSQESLTYRVQRLGGVSWLNESADFSNVASAIQHADQRKSNNINEVYRVAEVRNGKIVGTVYSC
jgi:hypothetical protein